MAKGPDYDAHSETDTAVENATSHKKQQAVGQKRHTIMQSGADAYKPTLTQTFLESSAKQHDVQLSHSKQRWHPLWSASQEITMHWQKKKKIFIHLLVNFLYGFWCSSTVCLQELKAAGERRKRRDKSGRVTVPCRDEMKLFLRCRHFGESFLSSNNADPSVPLLF